MEITNNTPFSALPPVELLPMLVEENRALKKEISNLQEQIISLKQSIQWFQNQLFGTKSEKLHVQFPSQQVPLPLGATAADTAAHQTLTTVIPEHQRRGKAPKKSIADDAGVSGLRFDSTVEVVEVECPNSATEGLSPDEYQVIGYEVVDKLCERKSSYFVTRYKRPKVKLKTSGDHHLPGTTSRAAGELHGRLFPLVHDYRKSSLPSPPVSHPPTPY